ncbi:Uncharacterized protein FWK35_00007047, partial [Aphis craccivora]
MGIFTQNRFSTNTILDSERSDECIDFTMIITSRNNHSISNLGGCFRWQGEYPWFNIEVKSKHFSTVFKKNLEKQKKVTEKREFLRKTSFRPNQFFYMVVIQKLITVKFPHNSNIDKNIRQNHEYLQIIFDPHLMAPNVPTAERYPLTLLNLYCFTVRNILIEFNK